MHLLPRAVRPLLFLIVLIVILILFLFLGSFIFEKFYPHPSQVKFGVTFSPRYARYLKLDWQKTYLQILDELKVKNIRLTSYWDTLETEEGKYDFSETDFLIQEAKKRAVNVILSIGVRQPRWPECHIPNWAKKITVKDRQQKTLDFIKQVVTRYQNNPSIVIWQIENEPFAYWFGKCDPLDRKFLQEEIDSVKKFDKKPILLTDSGEWGSWVDSLNAADILGISIYRKAYNSPLNSYLTYPFPAGYYNLKGEITKKLAKDKKIIISELQMEPWLAMKKPAESMPIVQSKLFSAEDFKKNIEFVKKTGFDEIYLWGVEWWYFMKNMGYPQYLEYAKSIF